MTFNVNDMRAQLQFGGARNTLFSVSLTYPSGLNGGAQASKKTSFMVKASSLPATLMGKIAVPYFGRKIYVVGDRDYQEWPITVINDEDFAVRHAFEAWIHAINRPEGNAPTQSGNAFPSYYKTDADIIQYGKNGPQTVLRQYKFYGVFPTQISNIQMDWAAENQIEMFEVGLSYDYFEVVKTNVGNTLTG